MTARLGSFFGDVRGTALTGLSALSVSGAITDQDTVLTALAKLQASINALGSGTSPGVGNHMLIRDGSGRVLTRDGNALTYR